ncbi:MAG: MerR family transcriptional regulator [Chloroflexi bacterium]|nr:MAG: MerR family transcriptional regulator [Chloroflexota bacterium]
MRELTIGEVARRAGIRTSALRYYESIGLLPAPRRVNGWRRYDESILPWVALIQLAQRAGFTIAEIQTLFHGFTPDTPPATRWRTLAAEKIAELDALIERAQQMKDFLASGLRCNCLRLEDCAVKWEAECKPAQHNST